MNTNYLLIDYENVQTTDLSLLKNHEFKVLLFLGSNQTKIPVELAKNLQSLGQGAEYVQISGNGPNALDFHIAFTIGLLSAEDPKGHFHIISKDTGFDPLIEYAKAKKSLKIYRSKEISEIPFLRLSNKKSDAEKVDAIVRNLANRGASRPRKVKTLRNTINSLFQSALEDSELSILIKALEKLGHLSIENESVTYRLPAEH